MNNIVEVMLDKAAGNLSLIATDDVTGETVEHTLSVEIAWNLVSELNAAIQKLLPHIVGKNAVVASQEQVIPVSVPSRAPEQVQAAVLEAIGADQKRPRHVPPGFPATLKKAGLREYVEPEPVGQ